MKTFQFVPGLSLRVVDREGEPWFVAKDVAEILGLRDGSRAVEHLDTEDKAVEVIPATNGRNRGNPRAALINESGLYSLILKSRKPEAKAFKRWITGEVSGGPTDRQGRGIPLGKTTHGTSHERHT